MFGFLGNISQFTYQFFATIANWFLGIGNSFFGGVAGWVDGWFN
jgi:hypothetical protein